MDEEIRKLKQAQIGLQTVLDNVFHEYFTQQDEDKDKQQQIAAFETLTICDEEQPSITSSSRTKTSNAATTCPSEQQTTTRESSSSLSNHNNNHLSQHLQSQSLVAATKNNNNNNNNNDNNTTLQNKINSHDEFHQQSSTSSLELQKQVIKHCFTESFHSSSLSSRSCSHSSSNDENKVTWDRVVSDETINLNDHDQEQSSSIVPKTSIRPSSRLQQHTSSSSMESTLSTPGAFLMRGSSVTGRAQVGMITPYDPTSCGISSKDEPPMPASASLRIALDDQNDDLSPDLSSSNIDGIERKEEKKKKKKKLLCVVGIATVAIVLVVVILVVVVPSSVRPPTTNASDNKNNNDKLFGDWSDLISECDNQGRIDLSMFDPITIIQYQDLQRQFLPSQQAEVESCSPQQLALLSLSIHSDRNRKKSDVSGEEYSVSSASLSRYILSVFFFSLQGNEWHNNFGWLETSINECQWFGVECSQNNDKIIGLDFIGNNLLGTIPNEIYQLTNLQKIRLPNNDHLGTISPMGIQSLTNLAHFNVFGSALSGSYPSELFALPELLSLRLPQTSPPTAISGSDFAMLSKLTSLTIAADVLDGSIPTEIGLLTTLETLDILGAASQGLIPIPHELAFLPALEELRVINGALFTGTIPEILFETKRNWRHIDLSGNFLKGTIPSSIGTQKRLETLDLFNSRLSGSIPPQISNCSSLKTLSLSNNRLEGTIPTEIGRMSALESLHLHGSMGTLPTEIERLENLKSLVVTPCQGLSGTIPSMLCHNNVKVRVISSAPVDCNENLWRSCQELACCVVGRGDS